MKIKQTNIIGLLIFGIMTSALFGLINSLSASAYTCQYSNGNGSYKGEQLKYDGGNCYIWKTGEANNDKRQFNTATQKYECTGGTVMHSDGDCYTLRKEYTNVKPTNDDGSAVSDDVWRSYCESSKETKSFRPDATYEYNSDRHRCEGNTGYYGNCNLSPDDDSVGESCFAPGMDGRKDIESDENLKDQTTAKVKDCQDQGGTINQTSRNCEWTTKEACEKRSQGVWVKDEDSGNGSCRRYSDFPSQQACEKVGGEFKMVNAHDANNAADDEWRCVKPGTNGDDPANPAGGNTSINQPSGSGVCGKTSDNKDVQTNLISCNGKGIEALGDVLKQILSILTIIVGIAAVGGIAYAAVLYASATDNASQTQQAIGLIRNIVIGIVVYGFMIAIINWLVPGGVIG